MPEGQQPQETAAAVDGGMVRACDRCGTICSADQEWCLACGVRMSPVSSRLPGLRAAGVVVSLAVLLAGGAAAASYAALRSDTSTTAAAPAGPAGTPVTPSPTPPPVTPAEDPAALPPVDEELPPIEGPDTDVPDDLEEPPAADPDLGPDLSADLPSDPVVPDTSGDVPADTGGDATDATDSTDTRTDTGTGSGSGSGKGDKTKTEDQTGPIELASGQGSLYDPDGIVEDRGDESRAIDGNVKTSWRATLGEGKTGEFGYVLDFDSATALKTLTLHSPTKGLKVKVLGTTRSTLPETTTDAQWVELAPLTTLKGGSGASTDFKLDGAKKLRHVLVLITETPGTPAVSQVNEIQLSR